MSDETKQNSVMVIKCLKTNCCKNIQREDFNLWFIKATCGQTLRCVKLSLEKSGYK